MRFFDGRNTLNGGAGDDALTATATGNAGTGGGLTNTLDGGLGNDALTATADARADFAAGATNTLNGGDGDDRLTATAKAEGGSNARAINTLDGGAGNDTLIATAAATTRGPGVAVEAINTLRGGDGDDALIVFGGSGNVLTNGGADTFALTAGDNALDAVAGFSGDQADKLDLSAFGAGATVAFNAANDVLTVNGESVATIAGDFDPITDVLLA